MRFQLLAKLLSLAAASTMALSTPALAQDQQTYKFQITNFTELAVEVTCESGGDPAETVAMDGTSGVITCSTDELTVVQWHTNITRTITRPNSFDSPGDTCAAEDVLHSTLGGTTYWVGGVVVAQYSSMYMNTSCES